MDFLHQRNGQSLCQILQNRRKFFLHHLHGHHHFFGLADRHDAGIMAVFKNPFFFVPCIIFWTNQYLEKSHQVFIPFVHAYLDDLMAMPVVLGITLQVFRWMHPLKNTFAFTKSQVVVGLLYFSFLFEFALPQWSSDYTGDIWDVVFYSIGALIFYNFINVTKEKR